MEHHDNPSADVIERAKRIKMIIFDVDGVLTDGTLFLGDDGQEYKAFHSKDGLGMLMTLRSGLDIGIITARSSEVVRRYMESRGIKHVYQGRKDKHVALQQIVDDTGYDRDELAYVGDDLVDLPCLIRVGLAVAVSDAHPEVKSRVHWQTPSPGGRGAARELCELVLKAQNRFEPLLNAYLS